MESNDVFETDAQLHAFARSAQGQKVSKNAPDVASATFGSNELTQEEVDEEGALLGQEDGHESRRSDSPLRPERAWTGDTDFAGQPWWRTPSIWWLLPFFILYSTAFGGTIVTKMNIILAFICRNHFEERAMKDRTFHVLPVMLGADNPQCQIPEVQSLTSRFNLYSTLISGILTAITSPKLGAMSDRYGRTRMIAVGVFTMILGEMVFILVTTYSDVLSVYWILLSYFFDGLGGSFIAVMAISYAYASDCTPPQRRNVVFGRYQGCMFGGMALGPVIGGYIVKASGNVLSIFYAALACHALFLIWLLLVVPESVTKQRRQLAARKAQKSQDFDDYDNVRDSAGVLAKCKRLLKSSNILAPLSILWPVGPGTNPAVRRNLALIAAVDTIMFGVAMGAIAVMILYSEFVFGWGNFETNAYMSIVSTSRVLVLFALLPLVTRILRGSGSGSAQGHSGCDNIDLGIIRAAILIDMLGYIGFSTVRTGALYIACGIFASVGGMGSPTLQSALTKHVPPDRTGQVLGAMGLLHAVARVVAPVIFNLIYAETVGKFTQTVFVCLTATWGLALLVSFFIRPHVYWDKEFRDRSEEDEVHYRAANSD